MSIIFLADHSYIKYIEAQNDPVYLDESNQEKIVFYRNDCRDCEKIMPYTLKNYQSVYDKLEKMSEDEFKQIDLSGIEELE